MSTPSTNAPQPKPGQGIPVWLGACIVGIVVLAGGAFLASQFMKQVPKIPTVRGTTRPGPGQPGGGPAPPAGGPAAPGMTGGPPAGGGATGGSEAGTTGGSEAGATGNSEPESGATKAEPEKESK